jgi:hypothetical protein
MRRDLAKVLLLYAVAWTLPCAPALANIMGVGTNYTTTAQWNASAWSAASAGAALDASYTATTPTLDDSFTTSGCPEIGNYTPGTPNTNPAYKFFAVAGGMGTGINGQTRLHDGTANDPYDCSAGYLKIKLFWSATLTSTSPPTLGTWVGGSIQSADWSGDGETFKYGYYEIKAALPATWTTALQPWMAIWLNGRVSTGNNPQYQELDMLELLTQGDPAAVTVTMHQWPANAPIPPGQITAHRLKSFTFEHNYWDGAVHAWGVLRNPVEECTVIDGLVQQCFPIVGNDMRGPMSLLVDTDLLYAPTDTTQTSEIDVHRVRFYPCPTSDPTCQLHAP